jgi:hypothetical protein
VASPTPPGASSRDLRRRGALRSVRLSGFMQQRRAELVLGDQIGARGLRIGTRRSGNRRAAAQRRGPICCCLLMGPHERSRWSTWTTYRDPVSLLDQSQIGHKDTPPVLRESSRSTRRKQSARSSSRSNQPYTPATTRVLGPPTLRRLLRLPLRASARTLWLHGKFNPPGNNHDMSSRLDGEPRLR